MAVTVSKRQHVPRQEFPVLVRQLQADRPSAASGVAPSAGAQGEDTA